MLLGMKSPTGKEVGIHLGRESCSEPRKVLAEAQIGVSVGRAIEFRKAPLGALNSISDEEGNTAGCGRSRVTSRPRVV